MITKNNEIFNSENGLISFKLTWTQISFFTLLVDFEALTTKNKTHNIFIIKYT